MQLEMLNQMVQKHLPASMVNHCQVGSFRLGCLRLIVTDPIWASELRYSLPDLRDTLRSEAGLYQLSSIKIDVALVNEPEKQRKIRSISLSDKARNIIASDAQGIKDDALKKALLKLADFTS